MSDFRIQAGEVREFPHGIFRIDADYVLPGVACVYLLREGDRLALIETGTANTVPHVLAAIAALGLTPEHLDYVIPTHIHLDHAAGAGALIAQCPNARLVIHPRGAGHMINPEKLEAGTLAVYGEALYRKLYGSLVPVPEDKVTVAPDNFTLDFNGRTLTFLDTPGHALHHFCIHDSASQSVFSGDTFGLSYRQFDTDDGRVFLFVTTTPVHFDPQAMRASIERIAALQPEQVYLTHFGPVNADADNLQQLLASLDAFVAIANAERGQSEGRHGRMRDALMNWFLQQVQARQIPVRESFVRQWLATDADLNAQGLEVWLQRQEKAAG
ncbi:MBL fold metallo-hydrolase [Parathalassolituus penaei]|uniref:MBL fold metallo-hydrolase n=1 Tax=Parathalassolituus penaei TaxID=2997323 RepID=A0A9X3EBQ8_9GAMM|nr:MBL fold metallo-hydrolase [Parathalassolituus penaei]MCY0964617.1 MBL fold metallo-hydrolase [Parathalassolituus penaei]